MGFIYMASPYSGTPEQQQERYEKARWAAAELIKQGSVIFSPIVHCHEILFNHDLPGDIDFWHWYDRAMIEAAHTFAILKLPGWDESKGIKWETQVALELKKRMMFYEICGDQVRAEGATYIS